MGERKAKPRLLLSLLSLWKGWNYMALAIESKTASQTILSSPVLPNRCQSEQANSSVAFSFVMFTSCSLQPSLIQRRWWNSIAWQKWPATAMQWSSDVRSPELLVNSSHHSIKDKSLVKEKTKQQAHCKCICGLPENVLGVQKGVRLVRPLHIARYSAAGVDVRNQCPSDRDLWIRKDFISQEVRPFASLMRLRKQQKSLLAPPLCTKLGFNQFQIQLCNPEIQMTTKWNAVCPHSLETTVFSLQEHLLLFIQVIGNANSWNVVWCCLLHFLLVYTHAVRVPESYLASTQEFYAHSIKL